MPSRLTTTGRAPPAESPNTKCDDHPQQTDGQKEQGRDPNVMQLHHTTGDQYDNKNRSHYDGQQVSTPSRLFPGGHLNLR